MILIFIAVILFLRPVNPAFSGCIIWYKLSTYREASGQCSTYYDALMDQCRVHDLLSAFSNETLEKEYFWINGGNICPQKCAAVYFNPNGTVPDFYIDCKDCRERFGYICNTSRSCVPWDIHLPSHGTTRKTQCDDVNWTHTGDYSFLISPVRRTLVDAHSWCRQQHGTSVQCKDSLKVLDSITLPDLEVFWIGVPVQDVNGGGLGAALAKNNKSSSAVSFTPNLWLIETISQTSTLLGCICVKKELTTTRHVPKQTTARALRSSILSSTATATTAIPWPTSKTTRMTSATFKTTLPTTTTSTHTTDTPTTSVTAIASALTSKLTTMKPNTPIMAMSSITASVTIKESSTTIPVTIPSAAVPPLVSTDTPTTTTVKTSSAMKFVEGIFTHISAIDGYLASPQKSPDVYTCTSRIECALVCSQTPVCRSFFFSRPKSICQINTSKISSNTALQQVPGAKYYEKVK